MKYYPETLIQTTLTAHGAPCTVAPAVLGYTCTTYTAHLDGGNTPQTVKKAVGALEIATGQKITYNANTGVGNTLKITIPNPERAFPSFFAFGRNAYNKCAGEMLIGIDTDNKPITANIMDTLSVLVAGATGSGKSVAVNNLVLSLAIGAKPSEIVFLMVDLKRTEFSIYDGRLPQLIEPVAYTFDEALRLIRKTADEIDKRYKILQEKGKRKADLSDFPLFVLVIDEYAQLRQGTKEARDMLDTLMNKVVNLGRACNVFAIIATQNPVLQVINSTVKYGCQTKICLSVNNQRHSINIIDCAKAVDLLGKGDALVSLPNSPDLQRVQICDLPTSDIQYILGE